MTSNRKLDRLLREARAFRFLCERKTATADQLGKAVLGDAKLPPDFVFRTGRQYGELLVSAGRARRDGKTFSICSEPLRRRAV